MVRHFFTLFVVLFLFSNAPDVRAQTSVELAQNRNVCFNGKYASLCKKGWLSTDELAKADSAERRENLNTCLSGRYSTLCKKHLLTQEDAEKVDAAERRVNLDTCLQGRYSSLCKRGLLTAPELVQVDAAEKRENFKTCISGRYKSLCKKGMLTEPELQQVLLAEQAENFRTCQNTRYSMLCDRSLLTPDQLRQLQPGDNGGARPMAGTTPATTAGNRVHSPHTYPGCESGHRLDSVSKSGEVVILESGSVWEVDPIDAVDAKQWRPAVAVAVCEGKLVNAELNEAVSVKRVR